MRHGILFVGLFMICISMLVACERQAASAAAPTPAGGDPGASIKQSVASESSAAQPSIFSAQYIGGTGDSRTNVRIVGRSFKSLAVNQGDCEESVDGKEWSACVRVTYWASDEYDVVVNHSAAWPREFVRVRGGSGFFSAAALVEK